MRTLLSSLCALALVACGGAHVSAAPRRGSSEPSPTVSVAPRSLDEALAANGLTRFEPAVVSREMGHLTGEGARVVGQRITLNVSAGWNQSPPMFARRADGTVVLVEARPTTVVDRHVPGGCRHFLGGRAWFETIVYELPEGAAYAGPMTVRWEDHVEVIDWTDTEADGSPCPPPAID